LGNDIIAGLLRFPPDMPPQRMFTMNRLSLLCGIAELLAALVLSSCGTTTPIKISGNWSEDQVKKGSIQKVLVGGISEKAETRVAFEDRLTEELRRNGTGAVATHTFLPKDAKISKEAFEQYFKEMDVDAVLFARLVSVDSLDISSGSYSTSTSLYSNRRDDSYYGYFVNAFDLDHEPGAFKTAQVLRIETRLFSTKEGKVIWAGVSETFNVDLLRDVIYSVSRALVEELSKRGVLRQVRWD
jgi:hypothetical protein